MGYKIFVSYKHEDRTVQPIRYTINQRGYDGDTIEYLGTARDYVDYLIYLFEGDEIYKGEEDEDRSYLKDETLKDKYLKDKLHDSSITVVLISPEMKDPSEKEREQFIPWEVSYSLKEIERGGKLSHSNAVLAVVLPDRVGSYNYYLIKDDCQNCHTTTLKRHTLFKILCKNMFNVNTPRFKNCPNHSPENRVYIGESSYIPSITWEDFLDDMDSQLDRVVGIQKNRKAYDITEKIQNHW